MKKRVLAAVLGLIVTVSVPFLTISMAQLEIWKLCHRLKNMGYMLSATNMAANPAPFSADAACEIRMEPGNGSFQILAYNSSEKRENGMQERAEYLNSPYNSVAIAVLTYFYETERAMISYRPGSDPDSSQIQAYLESISLQKEAFITTPGTPAAKTEIREIFRELQNMGCEISEKQEAGKGTPDYQELIGEAGFSADAVFSAQIAPGEGQILFHEYASPALREDAAQQMRDFYATVSHSLSFFETEHTLITFSCPPDQAVHGDPVREYLKSISLQ